MSKEEIKEYLEMNIEFDIDAVVDFIYNLQQEKEKYYEATLDFRQMLNNSVSKDRYNNLLKMYNDLKKKGMKKNENNIKSN